MAYPSFEQYNNAFSAHQHLLADLELKKGTVAKTGLGTPRAISGGFALTYTMTAGQNKYAVRCFHRESKALERRYQAIAKRLAQLNSPYFLKFDFQPKGISVDGQAYPVVKMAWAQGVTLGEFLEDNHGRRGALASLPASLLALSSFLEREHIAHGDMAPGNIMVSGTAGAIQLIDYDGMFVEDIRDLGNSELGNLNFQHPERAAKNPFGPTMDRFSLIALSLALKGLNEDATLWDKTKSEVDAIVFRASDFIDPTASSVFAELMRNPALVKHAQNFAAVCRAPIEKTPSLEDFLVGRNIPASTIQITTSAQDDRPKLGYMGVYNVLDANNYALCLGRVGDKVEVIGRIVEVKLDKARNGQSYIFINFGPWQGHIFKIAIWSEGVAAIPQKPDTSWVGKWVSVIGLMEPPYTSNRFKYSHLSISVTTNGQMTIISETEAKFRMTPFSAKSIQVRPSNREALDKLKQYPTTSPITQISQTQGASASRNKDILDSLRKAQGGAQSLPIQIPAMPPRPQQSPQAPRPQQRPEPPRQQQSPQPPSQKPPEQSLVGKFFGWLFT